MLNKTNSPENKKSKLPALAALGTVAASVVVGLLPDGREPASPPVKPAAVAEAPPATHVARINPSTRSLYDAVDDEALASGHPAGRDGRANTDIRDELAQAVELNKAIDPNFDPLDLPNGATVVVPDMPDVNGNQNQG